MLHLVPVEISDEYRKEWNVLEFDHFHLYNDKVKISDTLYRVGGLGTQKKEKYFILLKMIESIYPDSITTDPEKKKHLASHSCILNLEGKEKFVAERFDSIYLLGGVLFTTSEKGCKFIKNIETLETYCSGYYTSFASSDFLFVDNSYDRNEGKKGIIKINKHTGQFEIFK